jgi:hypothetical protein
MDVIAERNLTFADGGTGAQSTVVVKIGRPEFIDERGCWATPYQIVGPGEETREHRLYGPDSMQALLYVVYVLPSYLQILAGRGELRWEGDADLGFLPPLMGREAGAACSVGDEQHHPNDPDNEA